MYTNTVLTSSITISSPCLHSQHLCWHCVCIVNDYINTVSVYSTTTWTWLPEMQFSTSNHHSQLTIPGVLGRVWYLLFRSSLFCSKSLLKEQPWAIHSCHALKKSNHESLLSLFVKERPWANSSLKRVMWVIRSF